MPKLQEVVGRFLEATIVEPTLIHVEDAHLMDGASGDLFVYLLRGIAERPWLCSLTRRPEADSWPLTMSECARSSLSRSSTTT